MGSIGEIGGDELFLDVDETIFVAVAEDVERSKTTVLWAARNFSGKKICLLYVHRPARPASWSEIFSLNYFFVVNYGFWFFWMSRSVEFETQPGSKFRVFFLKKWPTNSEF